MRNSPEIWRNVTYVQNLPRGQGGAESSRLMDSGIQKQHGGHLSLISLLWRFSACVVWSFQQCLMNKYHWTSLVIIIMPLTTRTLQSKGRGSRQMTRSRALLMTFHSWRKNATLATSKTTTCLKAISLLEAAEAQENRAGGERRWVVWERAAGFVVGDG